MDLKVLESFIIVAEQNSFTRASEILGYSQSAISTQIKQLENMIGTPLFERINHTVKLTAKGQEVLKLSHKMLLLSEEMKSVSKPTENLSGTIRIAMAESLCHHLFWDNYAEFHKKYPGITLEVISARTEEMFEMGRKNEVDMIYTLDKHLYENNYITVEDHVCKTHFVASPRNPLCQMNHLTISDIMEYPLILTEKGMSYRNILEERLSKEHLSPHPFLEIGDTSLICHLIKEDMGISFLPDYTTEKYVREGRLKRLHIDDLDVEVWVQLLYHRDKYCSPEMKCVIDFLTGINF